MSRLEIDLKPVVHITTDAIGSPGKRVFYIQGRDDKRIVTLIVEKTQIQALASGVEEFLGEIASKFPHLFEANTEDDVEKDMHIIPPVDPLFRVGELHIGYHVESDLAVLIANEITNEEKDSEESITVRFWCTRSQLRAMSRWGLNVAARGRTTCPFCNELISPSEAHICPKKNGKFHS